MMEVISGTRTPRCGVEMEQATRNKLRNVVTQCRRLLEEAVGHELQGRFGIHASQKKDEVVVEDESRMTNLSDEDRAYRKDLIDYYEHIRAFGTKPRDTLAQLVREIAFTHLNRLCAYKMMEAREVYVGGQKFRETVSRGVNSNGVKFYLAENPEDERLFNTGHQDIAYRHFLDWLGGRLSDEIGILFSPDDPANRLYPPQRVLDDVLALINDDELAGIWSQDEVIGWVYQYFTPKELRDQARKESQAPRNSYELAFRNQFFTPRFIVEFLTDNTLGRIWYEMRKGNTALRDQCRYMVRRPSEVFLADGQAEPKVAKKERDDLSREELLRLPVYIPHRPKKDPREIRLLDPAVGSAHFLLYGFDIFLTIYAEAYNDPDLGPALQKDYPTLDELRKAAPGLILKHNLHGIDIDLRATQISVLALWLRCQRAFQEMGLKKDRPKITRSNIVCAEPMPGEDHMLKEFMDQLEPKLLGQLVKVVFDKMKLAGDAGSLLKIEEEIREAVAEARRQWRIGSISRQARLFEDKAEEIQQRFDLSGVSDAEFFEQAEKRVVAALGTYSQRAGDGHRLQRRLFTEDAARGFSFVELSHKSFDIVLMNPPFGNPSRPAKPLIESKYKVSKYDMFSAFVERGLTWLECNGLLGAITSRTGFFLSSFQKWREEIVLREAGPVVFADLGYGVLDTAMVETAAYCIGKRKREARTAFFRLLHADDKPSRLQTAIGAYSRGSLSNETFDIDCKSFNQIPGSPFAYWASQRLLKVFERFPNLTQAGFEAWVGLQTNYDFRWLRLWWEVSETTDSPSVSRRWLPFAKGGEYAHYYCDIPLVVNWDDNGREIKAWKMEELELGHIAENNSQCWNESHYRRIGVTWPSRTNGLSFRVLPSGCIFGHKGPAVFSRLNDKTDLAFTLAVLNSRVFRILTETMLARVTLAQSYEVGIVRSVPIAVTSQASRQALAEDAIEVVKLRRSLDLVSETSHGFVGLPVSLDIESLGELFERHRNTVMSVLEATKKIVGQIESTVLACYDLMESDVDFIESIQEELPLGIEEGEQEAETIIESTSQTTSSGDFSQFAKDQLSYYMGIANGRWDIDYVTHKKAPPQPPDPFDPLPICSPAMLRGSYRLAATQPTEGLALQPNRDGILVDDPSHSHDIVRRVRDGLEKVWRNRTDAIEREICGILGIEDLRDYFRRPGKGGFWDDHVSRYSKSRRKAPIYWLLQSSKKNYALWLYYHRLDRDILFKALNNYVEPKIRLEDDRLDSLRAQKQSSGEPGKGSKKLDKEIEVQEEFVSELRDFAEKLGRAAHLNFGDSEKLNSGVIYDPDLNDGVVLNIAPLHELVPWKEARTYWDDLMKGEYEWSTIGKKLREKGLVK
jgi:hypothetical protein